MSLNLNRVSKRFAERPAVTGVDLAVARGEFVSIVGPSGCGKSTLLRLIAGLEQVDEGQIDIAGQIVSAPGRHVAPETRSVGVVFQSYALWPHMTVRDNVGFPAEAGGSGRRDARAQADRHLATVGLSDYADRRPADLSGGQRQRVALARCLAQGAQTILMDEPLANLDPHLRAAMEHELTDFQRRSGATMLYITHDQREALAMSHRVAVMAEGRLLQCASPEEIYARPATVGVARFIGRGAVLPAQVRAGTAMIAGSPVAVAGTTGPDAMILLRPENLAVGGDGTLSGTVQAAFYRGGSWEAEVQVAGLPEALQLTTRHTLRIGETVALTITGGWAMASNAPGDDARRQVPAQPVKQQHQQASHGNGNR